jgi:hypothetical protein
LSCNKVFRLVLILAPALFSFFVLAHFPSLAFVCCFCCVLRSSSLKKYAVARIIFRAYTYTIKSKRPCRNSPPKSVKQQKAGFPQQQVSNRLVAGSSEAAPKKSTANRKNITCALCKIFCLLCLRMWLMAGILYPVDASAKPAR